MANSLDRASRLALLYVMFIVFCHFPVWCPGSGVVLDCIDFSSLPSYFLLQVKEEEEKPSCDLKQLMYYNNKVSKDRNNNHRIFFYYMQ